MITDVCVSLSRRKEDKVNGTGRFHVMKNRYGMDGITFSVKADTSTGHFEVYDYDPGLYTEEPQQSNGSSPKKDFSDMDKQLLRTKLLNLKS
jgi:hypothetical protein